MGRGHRVIDADYLYHVGSRGNNGEAIVRDRGDCGAFLRDLDRVARKFDWEVWSWCLMTNHVHLVLRTPNGGLSQGMQQLNGNNGRRMNRRHGRRGHLVQNRFFAVPLESEAHMQAAIAYVARNPVKAGLCRTAAQWPYSSDRATVGLEPAPGWLVVSQVLALFGYDREHALTRYRDMVQSGHLPVSDTIEVVSRWEAAAGDGGGVA
jgi:REP element-mobilizing transposase RayT